MKLPLPDRLRSLAGEPWPFDVPDPDFGIVHKTMREASDELTRLVDRVERLRGLCKTAVGMLRDAGRDQQADEIHALIGDMEDLALDRVPMRG